MRSNVKNLARSAMIAGLYVVFTYFQNILVPNSANFAIQFRASEALCVLACFTPAAISGLGVGCLVFNLSSAGSLPLDWILGTVATLGGAWSMWRLGRWKVGGLPLAALVMPALWNGLLVGWELTVYLGQAFWLNALAVAAGELAVLLTLGSALYMALSRRGLDKRLFG